MHYESSVSFIYSVYLYSMINQFPLYSKSHKAVLCTMDALPHYSLQGM